MSNLKYLLLYKQLVRSGSDIGAADAERHRSALGKTEADRFYRYLSSGIVLHAFATTEPDPLNREIAVPFTILTDGVFAWDMMLAHWVREYGVALPDEFRAHVFSDPEIPEAVRKMDEEELEEFGNFVKNPPDAIIMVESPEGPEFKTVEADALPGGL